MAKNIETLTNRSRHHRVAHWMLRNSPGLIYLAWVGVTTVWVVHSLVTWDQPDANLAGVVTFLQTMPLSLLATYVPALPEPLGLIAVIAILIAGAVVNAVVLNWLCRSAVRIFARSVRHFRGGATLVA
jgi:hypothetical protein